MPRTTAPSKEKSRPVSRRDGRASVAGSQREAIERAKIVIGTANSMTVSEILEAVLMQDSTVLVLSRKASESVETAAKLGAGEIGDSSDAEFFNAFLPKKVA